MRTLQPLAGPDPLVLPAGTASIGLVGQAGTTLSERPPVGRRRGLEGRSSGHLQSVRLDIQGWNKLIVDIPSSLRPPLRLIAVQIWEPGFGPTGTPGEIVLDDLHSIDTDGDTVLLDGFEERLAWLSTPTSAVSMDIVERTDDAFSDEAAVKFTFGKETNRGIRGISHASAGGPGARRHKLLLL